MQQINDCPFPKDLTELYDFVRKYDNIYIYDINYRQRKVAEYLESLGFANISYILPDGIQYPNEPNFVRINEISTSNNGVIIANDLNEYNIIHAKLQNYGLHNIHFLSERNKTAIPFKLTPHNGNNFRFEFNIVDHCNLSCKCCDHFSPIADKHFADIIQFEKDIARLADLNPEIFRIDLLGGEPTLHPNLPEFFRISRYYFPIADIKVVSNGLFVFNSASLLNELKKYDISLFITTYPIKIDYDYLDKKINEFSLRYCRSSLIFRPEDKSSIKLSVHHPSKLDGSAPLQNYLSCWHFNECIHLKDGKLYTCPIIPTSISFNSFFNQNLRITPADYVDIHKVKTFEKFPNFLQKNLIFVNTAMLLIVNPFLGLFP